MSLIKLNCHLSTLTRAKHYLETLKLFQQIHSSDNLRPDQYTLSAALSAAANRRDPAAGFQLHCHVAKSGLISHCHVENTLLTLYSKLQILASVKWVFDEIKYPDVYSWTTLLSACTKLGEVNYALKVFDEMPERRKKSKLFDAMPERIKKFELFDEMPERRKMLEVFDEMTERRKNSEVFDKMPERRKKLEVFDEMPERSTAVWNAVITGCADNGYAGVAFDLFKRMHRLGVRHDNYTFASVLSLCEGTMVDFGNQVHSLVIRTGFFMRASVINALLTMYFVCRRGRDVYRVFDEAEVCDEITYNSMIAGLVKMGRDEEALIMFREMLEVSLRPTELTFVSVMSSCSWVRIGFQLHVQVIKTGFDMYTSVGNAIITMYSSCGDIYPACSVFERLQEKDLVTWNTMISSYAQHNFCEAAMLTYIQMQNSGIDPDEFTIGSLCASSESIENVKMIQALVIKNGLVVKVEVSNALTSAFSKHGNIIQAYEIFEEISLKNIISWNIIISGLQLNGFPMQGLEHFSSMLSSGLIPNVYTLSIILSICGDMSSMKHGKEAHGYILRQRFSPETSLGNSLITIYAKTGALNWSLRVFDTMVFKDTISWNSLISAYAQHGKGKTALSCFKTMINSRGSKPDQATFTSVLSACSHAGLVEDGLGIFNSMVNYYGFQPKGDHFSCIIDLLGRAGYLGEAERLVSGENIKLDNNPWWALFSACVGYGDIRLGRIVAGILLENEGNDPSVYVQLSNIYSASGQWEEAANVREMMERLGVSKTHGCSWIR